MTDQKQANLTQTIGSGGKRKGGWERSRDYKREFLQLQGLHRDKRDNDEEIVLKLKDFFLPVELTRDHILDLGLSSKHISNVLLILSLIRLNVKYKQSVIRLNDPYATIHSVILSNFLLTLNNKTQEFLKVLERANWIEIDHSYRVGHRSKGYRLGNVFKNSVWERREWKSNLENFLPEILEKGNIARRKETLYDLWERACSYFTTWQNMSDGGLKDICRKTSEIGLKLTLECGAALDDIIMFTAQEHVRTSDKPTTLEETLERYKFALSQFDGESFYVKAHDDRFLNNTNRVYTNVTNINKPFRPFLRLNGKNLINVDIQACQFALLAKLYRETDSVEFEKFKKIICETDIYVYIAGSQLTRERAKVQMFKIMFDRNINQSGAAYERFKEEFPILNKRIHDQKREFSYKSVAQVMQSTEANIMIFGVLNDLLFKEKIECLSIHDSIFCLPEHAELVKEKIFHFFNLEMNFCPKINID